VSKYRFSSEQKFALWRVYNHKCSYCAEPIRLLDVTVDHILPEYLAENPDELRRLITRFNLGKDFSINDYCNWAIACPSCNNKKSTSIFETAPYYISLARRNASKAREQEQRAIKNKEFDKALAIVVRGVKQGLVSSSQSVEILENIKQTIISLYNPIVVTFGMNINEAWNNKLLGKYTPTYYPELCDHLEQDLINQLESTISSTFHYPEPSARNGETLSVRLAFVHLNLHELEDFKSDLWEILEVEYYSEIYGSLADGSAIDLLERIV
jgi:5-methylcytosine-specific restriction endonuclease McrA